MGKQSGLGDNFYLSGYDLSGDIGSLSRISGSLTTLDVTGIDKSGFERLGGLRTGDIQFSAFFNDAATGSHTVLSPQAGTDVIASYFRGTTIGSPAASMVAKQVSYDPTRGNDGSLVASVATQANGYGLEWGVQLTAGKRTDTVATNGTSIDYGATSTLLGLQAYLHVFSFTGTSVTVTLQDSADNVSFANITSAVFTAATGRTSERIAVTGTVRRYVRAITTGTFSSAVFAVQFTRNEVAVTF